MECFIEEISNFFDAEPTEVMDRIRALPKLEDLTDLQARMDCLLKENVELRARADEGDALRAENKELKEWMKEAEKEVKCRAPLLEECPQHHGHKGDPGVTPGTCGAIGERTQVILVWVRAPRRWERLPPMETRSHEGKALSIGWLMAL